MTYKTRLMKYLPLIKSEFKLPFIYPVWLWIGLFNIIVQSLFFYYFWSNISNGDNSTILTYVVISRIIVLVIGGGSLNTLGEQIYSGNIAIQLIRPVSYPILFLSKNFGRQLATLLAQGIPSFIFAYFVFNLNIDNSYLPLFLVSLLFSSIIIFYVDFLFSFVCFITNHMWGISAFREGLLQLFSGAIIPIMFFPEWLKSIIVFLPFQYIINSPIELITQANNPIHILLQQLIYIIILIFVSSVLWSSAVKKLSVQGG